MNILVKFEL